ncbi:MAG: helix-turn-helix transcriptional regulator [Caldisericia bacterium]|nr:helix-turn-helix transcriptional regulator [Caldisericia bacterium]
MNDALLRQFGKRVRLCRKELGLSQEELAAIAHLHRTYIGMIERGEKNITLTNIMKIACALDMDLHTLMEFDHGK